jgi:inner membrane protein
VDPLAHSLFGAALARTRLGRWSTRATPLLIIGANLPDIDAVMTVFGRDTALLHRRGWTHGILAMIVLPVLLAFAFRWWESRPSSPETRTRFRALLLLSALSVWSHPILDWLNTYGVRLLMPFDGRWFYGDTLFIVEPWFWLLGALPWMPRVAGFSRGTWFWIVLGGLTTAIVFRAPDVPMGTQIAWGVGVLGLVAARRFTLAPHSSQTVATSALMVLVGAIAGMRVVTDSAREGIVPLLEAQGIPVKAAMASPSMGNPFRRSVIASDGERYWFYEYNVLGEPKFTPSGPDRPSHRHHPAAAQAMKDPSVRGLSNWLRYPIYFIEETPIQTCVRIADARYIRGKSAGFASSELCFPGSCQRPSCGHK